LALCRAHSGDTDVTDATAFLLERSGDVSGALALTVGALDDKVTT
jgi:hypothetical protein